MPVDPTLSLDSRFRVNKVFVMLGSASFGQPVKQESMGGED